MPTINGTRWVRPGLRVQHDFRVNKATTKSMRCPDCNKFASYDEPQCEVNHVEVDDGSVRVSVTVQLNCAECGNTLKDAEIEAESEITHDCPKKDAKVEDEDQFELVNDGDAEGTNRLETKDRHGKPIKSSRYMKTFYGFTIEPEVKCRKCGEQFSVTIEGEEQASGFNECC